MVLGNSEHRATHAVPADQASPGLKAQGLSKEWKQMEATITYLRLIGFKLRGSCKQVLNGL